MAAAQGGDETAFTTLVERHQQLVEKIMWRFSRVPAEHEDLTHEVFVQFFLGMARYRGEAPVTHFLTALARKIGFRFWEKRAHSRTRPLPEDLADTLAAPPAPAEPSPTLFDLLSELKPDDRLALTLTYYDRYEAPQIAATLGWTLDATRMRLTRARRSLQEMVRRRGIDAAQIIQGELAMPKLDETMTGLAAGEPATRKTQIFPREVVETAKTKMAATYLLLRPTPREAVEAAQKMAAQYQLSAGGHERAERAFTAFFVELERRQKEYRDGVFTLRQDLAAELRDILPPAAFADWEEGQEKGKGEREKQGLGNRS
ncbi:MAG: sigma-70 family RNA polymerase sigma factor [Planctomycetota bacterium]|jgi:RNA polymerase sigma-70 factor (ECF subfamily)|nr:sigma-70 family RNA polymerase sigma factor [Planctomycetota bacterium]